MKTFLIALIVVCSVTAFGQTVTINHIELTQTPIQGVDDLAIWTELRNNSRRAITVRDMNFSLVNQHGDAYESYVGPLEQDGNNFVWGERVNPGVTADHILFFRVPSTINLHESMKLRLGRGHWIYLYGLVADARPNPTSAALTYKIGEPAPPPAKAP
jgi:hypothetical protein